MTHTIVICSGGLDSVTLAYQLANAGDLHLLAVDYGQRHRRELAAARLCAERLGAAFTLATVRLGAGIRGNALTDEHVLVPDGHWTDPRQVLTIVPNRNLILLSLAFALAAETLADAVAIGVHAGDQAIYPDCRPAFLQAVCELERLAMPEIEIALLSPFITQTKAAIVAQGAELGVPFGDTYSCYRGLTLHCGRCGACQERRDAFVQAGVPDPTVYDPVRREAALPSVPGSALRFSIESGPHLQYDPHYRKVMLGTESINATEIPAYRLLFDAVEREAAE